jgi:hypothetical protein
MQIRENREMAVEEGCFNLPTRNGARVLLSSVFGPYCQDDEYGSRAINPVELFHNQVTREQGSFSLRVFHPSLGIRLIQSNISAPCTLLDFPTLEIFEHEIASHHYDIIGISSIVANVGNRNRTMDRRDCRSDPVRGQRSRAASCCSRLDVRTESAN